eukprot:CAMPEP_0119122424 /NCGR_PEP_ID=MMETSP1310-20130426/2681_1 /TAXON_ID=464262 /ORGANISM="Genus nov. species nov., Strain RCC2339" /LENGTH=379 /DNA_ID=CAMNT_0007112075 /DNA_START=44 /DNA_END=1183 /DNA_ORIENTATION=-
MEGLRALFCVVFVVVVVAGPASAQYYNSLYVSALGSDSNSGTSPESAFLTIQAAVNKAVSNDHVFIMPGQYTGEGNTGLTIDKSLHIEPYNPSFLPVIRGSSSTDIWTFVAGDSSVTNMQIITARVAFSLTGGALIVSATSIEDVDSAVTAENATSLTVTDTTIVNCDSYCITTCVENDCDTIVELRNVHAEAGSGGSSFGNLHVSGGAVVTAEDCVFGSYIGEYDASSSHSVYNTGADLKLSRCTVEKGSTFTSGAGIYTSGSSTRTSVVDCVISLNEVSAQYDQDYIYGGGCYCGSGTLIIQDSNFTGNELGYADYAGYGGAVYSSSGCVASIFATSFTSNSVYRGNGGALGCGTPGSIAYYECTFSDNSPDDVYQC